MPTPLSPQNIHQGPDGRWYHDGTDVTDHPFAWKCEHGHEWHASLAERTGPNDPGCPTCNPPTIDPAAVEPETVNLDTFNQALTAAYDLVPTNIDNATRQETAQAAYQALLAFLNRNRTLIGVYDDEGGMTTLHHGYAVGIHGD